MRYRYFICDVFTDTRFGGNPLAVLPAATGLRSAQMLQITREFNFSETTFVLPAEQGHTRKVRIFTPQGEIPFAGHPNVGTAYVLASIGELGELGTSTTITFEEEAGLVGITIESDDGKPRRCELAAPRELEIGPVIAIEKVARALSLSPDDFVTDTHPAQMASVGLEFLFAELKSLDALQRARVDPAGFEALDSGAEPLATHVYVRSGDEFDIRARVFVPNGEDPATGSANCTLAAMLAHYDPRADGDFRWRIGQGIEMGRPSTLHASVEKRAGKLGTAHVGGSSVLVSEGWIEVD